MYNKDLENIFSKIEPDDALKNRIIDRIEDNDMKPSTRKKTRHLAALVACIAVIGITTAFAAGNIISYFQSDRAIEMTSMESLSKYNEEIGATASNFGYTLTLDNLATDDNFLHVFYTLKNENITLQTNNLWLKCRINGQLIGFNNHNENDEYLVDDHTRKGVMKLNVSQFDIPDTFKFEMYSEAPNYDPNSSDIDLYNDNLTLTDEDISKLLYLSTTSKKTNILSESISKEINQKIEYTNFNNEKESAEITKVIFSPFGNQFLVKDTNSGNVALQISGWAMYDENGTSLDILNTDLTGAQKGDESINSLEFLKADSTLKSFKLVPLKYDDNISDVDSIKHKIGTYPIVYEVNQYGKIVVTGITVNHGEINIDYYKDGFSLYDPGFELLKDNGEFVDTKHDWILSTRVHHDTNSYTANYRYEPYDASGNIMPLKEILQVESVSKENLEKSFTTLGIMKADYFTLDYDNAITINLK